MKSKILIAVFFAVVIAAVVFAATQRPQSPPTATNASSAPATSTGVVAGVDTSSWQAYSDPSLGWSIKYPSDLVVSTATIPTVPGPYLLALQFPDGDYFSTVLKDQAYAIVTAGSTCLPLQPGGAETSSSTIVMGGRMFIETQASDVGAGNIYHTIAYDTTAGGACYRLTFFDHGANGAGLYLSDQAQIQAADQTHAAELTSVEAIARAMAGTLVPPASQ